MLILPIQDVFGWRDRINQPATVGDQNWTWRLPWPSDRLLDGAGGDRSGAAAADCADTVAAVTFSVPSLPLIFAQVSFSVTVRLNTGAPGRRVGIDAEVAEPLELEARAVRG